MEETAPKVDGYSFYLNVVVINSNALNDLIAEVKEVDVDESIEESGGEKEKVEVEGKKAEQTVSAAPKAKPDALNLMDAFTNNSFAGKLTKRAAAFTAEAKSRTAPDPKKLVQDGARFMGKIDKSLTMSFNKIGDSITKGSENISKKANAFVASKTMMHRAEKAVTQCIPLVTEEIGVELSISKRFQQGPVFVLEVDMKGCDLFDLLQKVLGNESAEKYKNVREGLDFLGLQSSKQAFDKEILPKVRRGMMEKMSEIVPEKMKLKKEHADLDIQCVALEDAEEAKWLYTFLEFKNQMT